MRISLQGWSPDYDTIGYYVREHTLNDDGTVDIPDDTSEEIVSNVKNRFHPNTSKWFRKKRIEELISMLEKTDHKALSDYNPKDGEDIIAINNQRVSWRNEIRELENQL